MSPIAQARIASALTTADACKATGMSEMAYERAEHHPLEFTVGELKALCFELNADGRSIVWSWVRTFPGLADAELDSED